MDRPRALRALKYLSAHVLQVCPADRAECHQRVGIEVIGQCLFGELLKPDTRFQEYLDNGSERRLRCADDIRGSKEHHSVDEPDQALFITIKLDLVIGVSVQKSKFEAVMTKSA